MARTFSAREAKRFYDRFGAKQDAQRFYEDAALDVLVAHADFGSAHSVFEFGCGTGRFAARLLSEALPANARYGGIDVSPTMVQLARHRLVAWKARAWVTLSDGSVHISQPDASCDRFVATYVLDLLPPTEIRALLAEAHRVLERGGKLCVAGLTFGDTLVPRIVTATWRAVHAISPATVGGCRPLRLVEFLSGDDWAVWHHEVVVAWGIPSEVLVVTPRPDAPTARM